MKYIKAFDKGNDEAKIEFQKVNSSKGKALFYYKGKLEGEFTEEMTDNPKTITLTIHSIADTKADLVMEVKTKDQQNDLVTISFDFNGKKFSSDFKVGSNTIPSAIF